MLNYYVYVLTNQARGTLYIGVTNNITRRFIEHVNESTRGFTEKYHLHRLVYIEQTSDIEAALNREKQLKQWRRQWKINLIEAVNPLWDDLGQRYGMDPELNSG